MFTPRSARARQSFPRVPGRSSRRMANSLLVGMLLDLLKKRSKNGARSWQAETGCPDLIIGEIVHPVGDWSQGVQLLDHTEATELTLCAVKVTMVNTDNG